MNVPEAFCAHVSSPVPDRSNESSAALAAGVTLKVAAGHVAVSA